ncbi:hypothetical protein HDU67_004776 [Dinochytrium kinnereticum]|nr:hypothetical protein HDU67_004776 [Dinochytrium kinnereticum]
MSTSRCSESRVFDAPLDTVWKHVRPVTFPFSSAVKSVEVEGAIDAVGSIRKVTFKDGTAKDLDHSVTYEVIESNPPTQVLAAYHTFRLKTVTHTNSTFVEFFSEFASGENTLNVVEDSKYKKKEALEDLAKALAK